MKAISIFRSDYHLRAKKHGESLEVLDFLSSVKGICAFAVLTRLSGLDRYLFGELYSLQYSDKVGHLLFFGLLSVSFHYVASKRTSWGPAKIIGSSLLLVTTMAVGDEFSQIWFEDRKFEHLDLLANIVGAGVMGPLGCLSSMADLHLLDVRKGEKGRATTRSRWDPNQVNFSRQLSLDAPRFGGSERQSIRVLLVEDSPGFVRRFVQHLKALNATLEEHELSLVVVSELKGALQHLKRSDFDLVLVGLWLPDGRGIGVYDKVARSMQGGAAIALTGGYDWESIRKGCGERTVPSCVKDQLDSETLFWLLYNAIVEQKQHSFLAPIGFTRSFVRIKVRAAAC